MRLTNKVALITGGTSGIGGTTRQVFVMDGGETTGGLCSQWAYNQRRPNHAGRVHTRLAGFVPPTQFNVGSGSAVKSFSNRPL